MDKKRPKANQKRVPGNTLGSVVGLRGGFKKLRAHWNTKTDKYGHYEECWGSDEYGNDVWEPQSDEGNVASIEYIGGPRNGEVEF